MFGTGGTLRVSEESAPVTADFPLLLPARRGGRVSKAGEVDGLALGGEYNVSRYDMFVHLAWFSLRS